MTKEFLQIIDYPRDELATRCTEVKVFDGELKSFAASLAYTCKTSGAVGLAANQVADLRRVIAVCYEQGSEPVIMINPKIVGHSEDTHVVREGCMSFKKGQVQGGVRRYLTIDIEFQNVDGEIETAKGVDGLGSRVFQHELDHLNGVMFFDHMSKLRKGQFMAKARKHRG